MKVKVLGCGNAFSNINYNQSFLLTEEHEGKTRNLLVDCGYQVQASISNANNLPKEKVEENLRFIKENRLT